MNMSKGLYHELRQVKGGGDLPTGNILKSKCLVVACQTELYTCIIFPAVCDKAVRHIYMYLHLATHGKTNSGERSILHWCGFSHT